MLIFKHKTIARFGTILDQLAYGCVKLDQLDKNLQVYVTMPRMVITPLTFIGSGMFLIDSSLLLDIFNLCIQLQVFPTYP